MLKLTTMIKILLFILLASVWMGCSNPYVNPQTSKAVSEAAQLEEMKSQSALMVEQNRQLKRIADALTAKASSYYGMDTVEFKQPRK